MTKFLSLILIFLSVNGFAGTTIIDGGYIRGQSNDSINAAINPIAEKNTTGWTASNVTVARDTSAGNQLFGIASFALTSATNPATFISNPMTLKDNVSGFCEASVQYKGDGSKWSFYLLDGSNNVLNSVALGNYSTWQSATITYPCASGYKLAVKSTAASPANVNIGNFRWLPYKPNTQVPGGVLLGAVSISGSPCSWNTTSASFVDFSASSSCVYTTTGSAVADTTFTGRGTQLPSIKFASIPAGELMLVADGSFMANGTTPQAVYQFWDGTNTAREQSNVYQSVGTGNILVPGIVQTLSYSTAQTNVQLSITAKKVSGTAAYLGSSGQPLVIKVYWFPTQSQQFYAAQNTPASWSGYHNGNCTFSRTGTTPYADFGTASSSSCALSQLSNRNFGTVSSYGGTGTSAKPGIVFTPPRAGNYFVCATPTMNQASSTYGFVRLWDGTNSIAQVTLNTGATGSWLNYSLCGVWNAPTTASATLSLQAYSSSSAATQISQPSDTNVPAINWSIIELDAPMAMPFLQGNVSSSSLGSIRLENAYVAGASTTTVCSSNPCTVYNPSSSWISSVTWASAGTMTVNFTAGTFSAAPTCTANPGAYGTDNGVPVIKAASTSSVQIFTTSSSGSSVNGTFSIICMGPR